MLVASVHDPALFDPKHAVSDKSYWPLLIQHLDRVLHCHVIVLDEGESHIWKAMHGFLSHIPVSVQQRLNAIPAERIMHVPRNAEIDHAIASLVHSEGSAAAVSISAHPGVNALVAADDTIEALQSVRSRLAETHSLQSYPESRLAQREKTTFGAIPVGGRSTADFVTKILKPIVLWARDVTVVDKMLCAALFPHPQLNWAAFKGTIERLYEVWEQGYKSAGGSFKVISIPSSKTNKMYPEQARFLAEQLNLPKGKVVVQLKPFSDSELREFQHDRYIRTCQNVTVGFSHGLDVISPEGECTPCDVYLQTPTSKVDVVGKVMSARNVGECKW